MFKLNNDKELTENQIYYRSLKSEAERIGISTYKFVNFIQLERRRKKKAG